MNAPLPLPQADRAAILAALGVLFEPEDVIELRAIARRGRRRIDAGAFDGEHRGDLADAAVKLNRSDAAVYVTLNRIAPQVLGRYRNRIEEGATATVSDAEVLRRRWLLVDLDPVRPKDTAATGPQLEAARDRARAIHRALRDRGWPEPVVTESGNGVHLLYPLDLPNDADSTQQVRRVLEGLAARFDDETVQVDRSY